MSAEGGAGGRDRIPLYRLAGLVLLALTLAACASSEPRVAGGRYRAGHPSYKIGAPYQINGVWYYPKVDYDYDETGTASWYGEQFDGQLTANGEIYDLNGLTAAHRTLPLPSIVEVTNLQNGRRIQLRVNDRGPYAQNRIIDVSRRAAQLLGFQRAGTTAVDVHILKDESIKVAEAAKRGSIGDVQLAATPQTVAARPRPAPAPEPAIAVAALPPPSPPSEPLPQVETAAEPAPNPEPLSHRRHWLIASAEAEPLPAAARPVPPSAGTERAVASSPAESDRVISPPGAPRIFIQAGAFAVPENVQRARTRFSAVANVEVTSIAAHGMPLYRVRLGPVASVEEADRLLSQLVVSGYPDAHIVRE